MTSHLANEHLSRPNSSPEFGHPFHLFISLAKSAPRARTRSEGPASTSLDITLLLRLPTRKHHSLLPYREEDGLQTAKTSCRRQATAPTSSLPTCIAIYLVNTYLTICAVHLFGSQTRSRSTGAKSGDNPTFTSTPGTRSQQQQQPLLANATATEDQRRPIPACC